MVRRLETLAADAETLQAYLRQIAGLPRLSPDQERTLARRISQHGDQQALTRLVEANLRTVVAFARRYRHLGVPALDLIHEGNLGLIEAARRFDPDGRHDFLTHAFWWIRQALLHALAASERIGGDDGCTEGTGVGLAVSALQAGLEHPAVSRALRDDPWDDDDDADAAGEWGARRGRRAECDQPAGEGARVGAYRRPDLRDRVVREAVAATIEAELSHVDPRARRVARLRCGLHGSRAWAVEEIAARLRMPAHRVGDIEADVRRTLGRRRALDSNLN